MISTPRRVYQDFGADEVTAARFMSLSHEMMKLPQICMTATPNFKCRLSETVKAWLQHANWYWILKGYLSSNRTLHFGK